MTREEFKMAFDDAMVYDFEFLNDMPKHEFSARFKRRMQRIIRKANLKSGVNTFSMPKKLLTMAASFLIAFICTMQVDAISEPIIHFINTVYDKFNLITFDDHSTIDYIVCEYELTYIPKGFTIANYDKLDFAVYSKYIDNGGNIIDISQKIITHDSQTHFDNEHGTTQMLIIADMEVLLYSSDFYIIASWVQDNYNMTLSWTGEHNETEFIKMIESIKAVEADTSTTPDTTE